MFNFGAAWLIEDRLVIFNRFVLITCHKLKNISKPTKLTPPFPNTPLSSPPMLTRTMATWGGSTQCAQEEENGDEDGYLSDGVGQAEEEEEDASSLNDSFSPYPNNNIPENAYTDKENKDRLVALLTDLMLVRLYLEVGEEALHEWQGIL